MINTKRQRLRILILACLALLLASAQAFAQVKVTGKVTSSAGPETGVIVFVKGNAGGGTMTDADGSYFITVSGPNETLVFSLMGFVLRSTWSSKKTRMSCRRFSLSVMEPRERNS